MVVIALLIVMAPLLRIQSNEIVDDLDQRNINIARDRLAELKANRDSGGITQDQYDDQVAELELALSDDLELAKPNEAPQNQGRWLIYILLLTLPIISISLYWTLGDYEAIGRINDPDQASQAGQESTMPSPEVINQMVAKLADKLKKEPNNLDGWMMLGRSYKVMERYQESADAYVHAYKLAGERADVMLPYAEVLALSNKGNWSGKPQELVMAVLTKEPNHPTGLWFAAMVNAQQGDKKSAVTYLKKLEAVLPVGSEDKKQIHEIIVNTEGAPGKPPAAEKTETPTPQAIGLITVQVNLAEEIRPDTAPEDTVFIYAQAISGPKMPLAIVRKRVGDLPLSVSLSDADAMMPNMKLSNFKEIRLLARVSKSGTAMPQSGDLIGTIETVNTASNEPLKITINDKVK